MKPILRVRFGLFAIAALFTAVFAWSAAHGQFRQPRPPFGPPGRPPGMNPPGGFGGGGIGLGWRCPRCGQTGAGAIPPETCPGCGVHFINGMGNGSAGGIMGGPPGMNPGGANPPMNPGFPGANPPSNPAPPVNNPPAFNPVVNNPPQPNLEANPNNPVNLVSPTDSANTPSSDSSSGSGKGKMIALVVGIIVIGVFALLGGTFLVIYSMKSSKPKPVRRRRRRRDEDDDDRD